jgi:hypothetical protein
MLNLKPFGINMRVENTDVINLVFGNRGIAMQQNKTFKQPDETEQTKRNNKEKLTKQNGVRGC